MFEKIKTARKIREEFGYEIIHCERLSNSSVHMLISDDTVLVRDYTIVQTNGKSFHINKDGTPAYEERYDFVWDFENGIAKALLDDQMFHIGTDGKPLYEERYVLVSDFEDGVAAIKILDNGWGFIVPNGKRVTRTGEEL